jgi:hypothetical protein
MKIKNIQQAFYNRTFQRYEIVAPNIYLDWQFNEMDLMALRRSGYIDEIEIKLSRSDYLADFKKTVDVKSAYRCLIDNRYSHEGHYKKFKHEALQEGMPNCNYFSFLMPDELAEKCDIPEYAGLYTCKVDNAGHIRVREVKPAPLLHKRKITEKMKYQIGRKMAYRYWHAV